MHWVTLYDQLDDDLFEGELGEDEDQDYPRVLLDYQIISSKFTSMINRSEDLQLKALDARDKFELNNTQSSKRSKAHKLTTVSQTVEFAESRV